ncbi:hypothetical protein HN695_06310 [Candidatus Woesearchaeota archaeon]|jgi:hypothetical protein|nr:hypothetical protein [Candidatus Woesearchaeota archaeon]MBT5272732.1 hypothetical protein [Candidatus Woesearchaeota archaeon]MBT6040343.1 hypothetical protein [Candidatus Woesearchaeota archaeon]MBT6337023.1 hypothetical protein [Candidatus Woesearchaeota archaeon]MBT7927923.1 hypothetical protein [Candidatus Woesearchaeota archaeon]
MNKSKILGIVIIMLLLLFVAFAVYKFSDAPSVCYDSAEIDPVTDEIKPVGGCNPEYGSVLSEMTLPFILWLIIFVISLVLYSKSKK